MWLWRARVSPRILWLVAASLYFVFLFGYTAYILASYAVHSWMWWLACTEMAVAISGAASGVNVMRGRRITATYRDAAAGLDRAQRRQAARAWRRGAVPSDPAVLTAVLRVHDLYEVYRLRTVRRRRVTVAVLWVGVMLPVAGLQIVAHRPYTAIGLLVLYTALGGLALLPDVRERLRRGRLAQLRAAAALDPRVATAVADAVAPAPRPKAMWAVTIVVIAVVMYGALVGAAVYFSPKEQGCRAAGSIMHRVYAERDWFWNGSIGPGGRPIADFQNLAEQIHHDGKASGDDPDIAPGVRRLVVLVDQAVAIVARARRSDVDAGMNALQDSQTQYVTILDAIADEEKPLREQCQR